jgi:UDP-GlcNAc:undecaprenyl-phosphate GlcNAc-1-phosphate transferase
VLVITNAVNFMDNMDGLAAGIAAVAAVFFFVLAALEGQGLVASLAAALFGAALGFLFYNFAPAVSFMGDAGAFTLGFVLAVIGIKLRFVNHPLGSTWMAPLLVLGVLLFDMSLVVLSRLRRRRSAAATRSRAARAFIASRSTCGMRAAGVSGRGENGKT